MWILDASLSGHSIYLGVGTRDIAPCTQRFQSGMDANFEYRSYMAVFHMQSYESWVLNAYGAEMNFQKYERTRDSLTRISK